MYGIGPRRARATMAIACAGALALTACGGSSKAGSGNRDTTGDAAILGSSAPATGTELKLGLVSDGKSATIDNSAEIEAAKATVAYLNEFKNGIDGHKVTLEVCETKEDPGTAGNCGQQMLNDGVAAVLVGVSGQASGIFGPLKDSGIPFFTYAVLDAAVASGKTAYIVSNGFGSVVGAPLKMAKEAGYDKTGVLVSGVPSAEEPVKMFKVFYDKQNIGFDVQGVSLDQPDFAPQAQAMVDGGDKQTLLVGDQSFCTSAITALKNANYQGKVIVIPQCLGEGSDKNVGTGGYKGMTLSTTNTTDPNDPDVKLYNAVMNKYSPSTVRGNVATGGYIAVKAFADGLEGVTGDLTPATINATLQNMKTPLKVPMGGGITWQCGTKPYNILPDVCSYQTLTADLAENGSASNFQLVDSRELTKL
jgi:branched-chain amino acid transport system substrate-binding protein